MPFQSTNAKPLSTLNSRNILTKENVPKSFGTSSHLVAAKKASTTTNTNTNINATGSLTHHTKKQLLTGVSEKQASATRTHSNLPKLGSTKLSEKENALVVERASNLQGSTLVSRLPLKSIKKPNTTTTTSATRPATVTRGFSQPVNALKHTSLTSSSSTRKPSKPTLDTHPVSSVSENVLSKDSSFSSVSSVSTAISLTTSTSSSSSSSITSTTTSSSSSTYSSLPLSSSKVPKSIPKKRVINEENMAATVPPLPTISSSPLDDDKENRIFASSISSTTSASSTFSSSTSSKYSTSKYSSESLGEELDEFSVELDSATSTARSKKMKITDSDASNKTRVDGNLSKFNYKSIHLHEEVIEEQDEQEWTDKENRENESHQHRQSAVRAVSQPTKPLAPSHAFPTTTTNIKTTTTTTTAAAAAVTAASKQLKEHIPEPKAKPEWVMVPPPSLTLSEKMSKFGIPEIDVEDVEDVTLCAEYVQEILEYLMRREKMFMPAPTYIELHPELQWHMRVILVDWLMEVSQKFKFLPETIFLGVNIMDRFLSKRTVSLNKFQLVGLASLFIAAKIEEIYCPPVSNFTFMTDSAFNDDEMLRAEQYILKTLAFEIWAPGPFSFIRRISKVDDYNADHRAAAKFLAEASLLTHQALRFPPSLLAAATMYLSRWVYKAPGPRWSPAFQAISGYHENDLMEPVQALLQFLLAPCDPESFFFKKKYIGKKFVYILYELRRLADEIQSMSSSSLANTSTSSSTSITTTTTTTTTTSAATSSFTS